VFTCRGTLWARTRSSSTSASRALATGAPSLAPELGARCATSYGRPRSPARTGQQTRADVEPEAEGVNRDNVPGLAAGPLPLRKPAVLGASALVACHVVQRLDIADAEGPCRAAVPDHLRHMVGDENAAKIYGHEGAHDLLHVRIAVIDKGLDEARIG